MKAHIPQERSILLIQLSEHLGALRQHEVIASTDIAGWEIRPMGHRQPPGRAPKSGWRKIERGTHWGDEKADYTVWFRSNFEVPREFLSKDSFVELAILVCREGLMYLNGKPFHGLSKNHKRIRLNRAEHLRKPVRIEIEAYTKGLQVPWPKYFGKFEYTQIRQIDRLIYDFCWDFQVVLDTVKDLDPNSTVFHQLLEVLNETLRMVHPLPTDRKELRARVAKAQAHLKEVLKDFPSEPGNGKLVLAGHSHIDTAWLWPLLETQRKVGRTFSTVLHLMEINPEYHFSQGQPQLYQYTKKHYPEVYAGIKKRVAEGRWDPAGPAWVEMDSNLSGGEALVRQFLYGNRFFEREFGVRNDICWLPDAFGYSWNLPQILVKSGIRSFVTTKIDWSMITTFPYTTFLWEGADGSRILGMMPPLNYNGNLLPSECRKQWKLIRQKNLLEEIPFSFGWGDGGGGPTQEMIENGRRLGNLTGVPQCRFGTLTGYYEELHEKIDDRQLPVWNGELYLELHRACQITQARTKRNNRKMELLLRETEWFSTQGHLRGEAYPGAELLSVWEEVLTAQFHDILPGSGTEPVYQEADEVYARVEETARGLLSKAVSRHTRAIDTRGKGSPVLLFNSLSWDRTDPVCLDADWAEEADLAFEDTAGNALSSQRSLSLEGTPQVWIASPTVPAHGHTTIRRVSRATSENLSANLKVSTAGMENDYFNLRFDRRGQIVSVFDKRYGREVLAKGGIGNELQLFHDRPHMHDAWDYDFNVDENRWTWDQVDSFKVVEEGPVRCALEVRRQTEFSTLVQRIVLYRTLARIDFETQVDWWEKHVLLKAAFPVAIRSSRATYEIQFATIERATHNNTPFDRARFEVAHHRWLDLSEGDYGVTLANDCKYGSDVEENVIRLSLLRASTSPDPHADEGRHKMVYSLIPHAGDWREGESVRRAYELNSPIRAIATTKHDGELPATYSLVRCDRGNVVVETLKKEEDGKGVVLRVYEAEGCRGEVNLTLGFEIQRAEETDLMERDPKKARHTRNNLRFHIAPYEIKTFRLIPKG